jgi:hypothetical protein
MCLACEMDGQMDGWWFAAMEARAHAAAQAVPPATLPLLSEGLGEGGAAHRESAGPLPNPEGVGSLPDARAAPRFACEETQAE